MIHTTPQITYTASHKRYFQSSSANYCSRWEIYRVLQEGLFSERHPTQKTVCNKRDIYRAFLKLFLGRKFVFDGPERCKQRKACDVISTHVKNWAMDNASTPLTSPKTDRAERYQKCNHGQCFHFSEFFRSFYIFYNSVTSWWHRRLGIFSCIIPAFLQCDCQGIQLTH